MFKKKLRALVLLLTLLAGLFCWCGCGKTGKNNLTVTFLKVGKADAAVLIAGDQTMVIDAGETDDIHPTNKFIVGNRLALWALAHVFNKDVECCSPMVKDVEFADGKATITFDHVGAGLVAGKLDEREFSKTDDALRTFAIAGEDGKYVWAKAEIVATNKVVVSADSVANPTAVRYAFQMYPDGCNLYSAEGLPTTPFECKK